MNIKYNQYNFLNYFFFMIKAKTACPCLNDGICIQTNNNFTCSCKTGFNGTNCETCKY